MTLAAVAWLLLLVLAAATLGHAVEVTSSSTAALLRAEPPSAAALPVATALSEVAGSSKKVEVQVQAKGLISQDVAKKRRDSVTSIGELFEAQEAKQEQEISELETELKKIQERVEKPAVTVKLKVEESSRRPANAEVEPKKQKQPMPAEVLPVASLEELATQKAKAVVNKDVQYSVYVRRIYDIDVKEKTWEADLVIALSWYDKAAHAPASSDMFTTYDVDEAQKIMWMPDVAITNRNMKGVETVSVAVKVWPRIGWVSKVERVSAQMLNLFDTSAYPFDNQTLRVVLSSTKYMSDEVSLRPHEDPTWFGVKQDCLKGTGFVGLEGPEPNYTYQAINETDGELKKCRGIFYLQVKRDSMATSRTIFEPTLTFMALPYGVFFFPRLLPFSMPRLATSLIPLLCMMTYSTKNQMPDSWLDVYFEMVILMISSTFVWSLLVEIVQHTYKNEELANRMLWELKIIYPVTIFCLFVLVFFFSSGNYNDTATTIVRFILVTEHSCILYFALKRANPQQEAAEGGESKDATDAPKDSPPVPDSIDKPAEDKLEDSI